MPGRVVVIHGWSDTSASFRPLRQFLIDNGFDVTHIWLGDYISLDDDVRIEDAAKRMQAVLQAYMADRRLQAPFDLVVHSTGGLLVREWLARYYPNGTGSPVKRIVMLAPANFGSGLAHLGKSMIGRLAKGWNNWLQTGKEMLLGLELASPYQWNLARRDLLDPSGDGVGPYGADKVWPFVIVGSRAYPSGLRQIINENGADGTVRAAAANLNAVGLTVDFAANPARPDIRPWRWRSGNIRFPFAVLPDRNHSTIIRPNDNDAPGSTPEFSNRLGQLILQALACDSAQEYAQVWAQWREISEQTAGLARDTTALDNAFQRRKPEPEALHQYFHVVTLVRDDHGQPVDDYFMEFFAPKERGDRAGIYFHKEVLENVHVNGQAKSLRALYVDRNDLLENYYPKLRQPNQREVAVSISAARIGPNVRYFDKTKEGAAGHLVVHRESEETREELQARLLRNTTHLVEIVIPRQPRDKVFKLTP